MSTSIEAQGLTVDEAIQIALNQLGVSRDKVEIDILHHPRRGVLGIGARRAKVRATIRESVMPDGEEFDMSGGADLDDKPRRRRRRGGRSRNGGRDGDGPEGTAEAAPRPAVAPREPGRGDAGRREGDAGRARGGDGGRSRDDRRGGGRGRGDQRGGDQRGGDRAAGSESRPENQPQRGGQQQQRGSQRGGQQGRAQDSRGEQARAQEPQRSADPRRGQDQQRGSEQQRGPDSQRGPEQHRGSEGQRDSGREDSRDRSSQRGRQGSREQGDRRDAGRPGRSDSAGASAFDDLSPRSEGSSAVQTLEHSRGGQIVSPRRSSASEEPPLDAETLELVRARAEELVTELLKRMGFAAEVSSTVDEAAGEAVVSVRSDSEGLLIGRRGQTLDSLEHIVNRMTLRAEAYVEGRVLLDIGDYRKRRRDSLDELATRLRGRAVDERRTVQVSPMSPRDRRFFAQAFADDESVEVRSLGAGFYRRVIVAPAGMASSAVAAAEAAGGVEEESPETDSGFTATEAES